MIRPNTNPKQPPIQIINTTIRMVLHNVNVSAEKERAAVGALLEAAVATEDVAAVQSPRR